MKLASHLTCPPAQHSWMTTSRNIVRAASCATTLCVAIAFFISGCEAQATPPSSTAASDPMPVRSHETLKSESLTLKEGDVIKVSFPGAPNLETVQTIRNDGRIALALVGEVQAGGLKPAELQSTLVKLYSSQLVSKEVLVTVVSSTFPVYVSGAVLKPGKIESSRPISALEAIMEAGGPDYAKANLKNVTVIRKLPDGKTQNYPVNLRLILEGKSNEPFALMPSDIIFVPDKLF